jgi:hypothetical protein
MNLGVQNRTPAILAVLGIICVSGATGHWYGRKVTAQRELPVPKAGLGGSGTFHFPSSATWSTPTLSVEWKAGRIVYAGFIESKPFEPGAYVVDENGNRVTHALAGWHNYGADIETEIGLRSDGVVVWRKAEGKTHE